MSDGRALQRARIGAFVLVVTTMLPILVATVVYATLQQQPDTDDDTRFGFATLILGVGAVASVFGLGGVFAFTQWRPVAPVTEGSDAVITLRLLAVLKTVGDLGAFGVVWAPTLQVWQTSLAITIVEIAFAASLLRFIATILEAHGATATARSTRQFVWVYAVTRVLLMLVWLLPEELAVLAMLHRALAPILDGVIAFLLVKCAVAFAAAAKSKG